MFNKSTNNNKTNAFTCHLNSQDLGGLHGRDRMVVGFTTSYAISAYHHCTDVMSSNLDKGEVYNIMS